MTATEDLAELVRRAQEGEVLGVALFARLADLEEDGERKRKLDAARRLEEQTLGTAEALAQDLGVELRDPAQSRRAGEQAADALGALPWADRMRAVADATGVYRSLYEDLGQATSHPAVEQLLAHERALHRFAAAEAAGELGSLSGVLDASG